MPDPTPAPSSDPTPGMPRAPLDRVTDLLRGVVAREAEAARKGKAHVAPRVRYLGDYELLEEIARGGMGVVYRARQVTLNRPVALKMILAGQLADDAAVARFRAEAEAAANLHHPNIVVIHEIGEHEGQHYFSMELVEGTSLAQLVAHGPLPARRAATYVRTVAEAIHHAHQHGTLHRDLKPSNVLIGRDDQPRVTDFGLAKRIEGGFAHTASGTAVGTPSYMPPEQALGRRALVGPASDVYSLGALLYELVTGRPPFASDNPFETLQQVLEHRPAAPRLVNPSVPRELDTIISKCLEKRIAKRYRTAQELADDLGRFLARTPIHARPASRLRHCFSWARRHPWSISAAVASVCVAILVLACWLWAERALLQHMASHPEYVRERGPRTEALNEMMAWAPILVLVLVGLQVLLSGDTRRARLLRGSPIALALVGTLGALGAALGLYVAVYAIGAYVWEDAVRRATLVVPTGLMYVIIGAELVVRVVRIHDGALSGAALELSDEQEEDLYELLADGPKEGFGRRLAQARTRYMEWTGADAADARRALRRMRSVLHSTYPERVPGPRTLLTVTLILVAVIAAAVLLA